MFFCPNCNNTFDITKNISDQRGGSNNSSQVGGDKYENIIKDILANNTLSESILSEVNIEDITKNNAYKRLKAKQKEIIYNRIQDLLPVEKKKLLIDKPVKLSDENGAFFICNNCGFTKSMEPKTLIISRASESIAQSYEVGDYKNMMHSDILPITRKYTCPNNECESHTDPYKKEAVFFRLNNSYKIKYLCRACGEDFSQ